jgi:uncharacterized protein DUF3572
VTREIAEQLALQALQFLTSDGERLGRFLALSGLDPDSMRAAAFDESFLTAILEYLMGDESLLLVFATDAATPPEDVATAWQTLTGYSNAI